MEKVHLTVNGMQIAARESQTVLQAALNADIYIPHLCFHPDLTPQGGCKLCVVEIEGVEGAVTSCTTPVQDGMVIKTKSEHLSHLRAVALELLLACHPADCTSCPVYLNCELQAVTQYLGVAHSRLRKIDKKNIKINNNNPLIVREMERCIQCGRCIRACLDIRNVGILQYNQKDGEIYVGTEADLPLKDADCRFCGACVEVCPTGALRDKEGIFSKESPREKSLIPCSDSCPVGTDIPTYIRFALAGQYSEAVGVIREKIPFPLSLGYVCNHKCETACRREKLNSPISVRNLKRFAVENDKTEIWKSKAQQKMAATGKQVAVIGAGPAGLTAAFYLTKKGHTVTVYEKLPIAGGMMAVGIPAYRLPNEIIDNEMEFIKDIGVEIITNTAIKSAEELKNSGYDAVLIAVGAHMGRSLPVVGTGQKRVYTAVETRLSLLYTYGVADGRINLNQFVALTATNPAKIFGLYPRKGTIAVGSDADITVWDPRYEGVISAKTQAQLVDYSPFEGFEQKGQAKYVYLRGRLVVAEGQLTSSQAGGQYLCRKPYSTGEN